MVGQFFHQSVKELLKQSVLMGIMLNPIIATGTRRGAGDSKIGGSGRVVVSGKKFVKHGSLGHANSRP